MSISKYVYTTISVLFFLCFCTQTRAQTTYYNEWIDYNLTYYAVKVGNNGLHRIVKDTLEKIGLPLDASQYALFKNGKQVPIYVSNTPLDKNDYIEFYGEINDGSFDKQLYLKPEYHLADKRSLFTDTSIYFLAVVPYGEHMRYLKTDNIIDNPPPAQTHFDYQFTETYFNQFFPGEPFRKVGGLNNYYGDFESGETFISLNAQLDKPKTFKIKTPSVFSGAGDVRLTVSVVGQSDNYAKIPDHRMELIMHNISYVDTIFEGNENYKFSFLVPAEDMVLGQDSIVLKTSDPGVPGKPDYTIDNCALVYTTIEYPHTFDFNNQRSYKFTIDNTTSQYLEITNFDGGTAPILFDLTNQLRITPVKNGSTYQFLLHPVSGNGSKRTLFFTNTTNTLAVKYHSTIKNDLQGFNFTDFSKPENQGNYIIISHPTLMQGDVNNVAEYALYRASDAGGGYKTVVANIYDLYGQYAYGIFSHPMAIRGFINYALEKWTNKPQYLLLLGKGLSYNQQRTDPNRYGQNLVPTWGHMPNDGLFTADYGSYVPKLATGRVPARTAAEVGYYLAKVKIHETPLPCTRADRLWRKNAVHIAGGKEIKEATSFLNNLNEYKQIYEDSTFAGKVIHTYTKANEDPIDIVILDTLINKGLGLISFVGHASGSYWDMDIGPPSRYKNYGKFPFIIASSCFVGDVYNPLLAPDYKRTMSEDYVLADNLGSIGFIAPVQWGFPTYMDDYVRRFYKNFCRNMYYQPVGSCIKVALDSLQTYFPKVDGIKITAHGFAYIGDPAIKLGNSPNPEYIIESNDQYNDVYFTPLNLNTNIDSFAVNIVVTNLGKATNDSLAATVVRTLPNGTQQEKTKMFPPVILSDILQIYFETGKPELVTGKNEFAIYINGNKSVTEDCYDNNFVAKSGFVFSELLVPIAPCNYSIVAQPDVTLMASTGKPDAENLAYIIEIDSTALFNSTIKKTTSITSSAGVLQWKPNLTLQNNTVYYWRAAQEPSPGDEPNWIVNSFLYKEKEPAGWNQSHYFQYTNNELKQLELNADTRKFAYKNIDHVLAVRIPVANGSPGLIKVDLDVNYSVATSSCLVNTCNGGIVFAAFAPDEYALPMTTKNQNLTAGCNGIGTYGNLQCNLKEVNVFEWNTSDATQIENMLNFVNNVIPNGWYVLAYSVGNHRLNTTDNKEPLYNYNSQIVNFFKTKLNINAAAIDTIKPNEAFVFFSRKNYLYNAHVNLKKEYFGKKGNDTIWMVKSDIPFSGGLNVGSMNASVIGPAKKWHDLKVDYSNLEGNVNYDIVSVDVFGVDTAGQEKLLLNTSAQSQSLSGINAEQYPFMRLALRTADTLAGSAPQLNHWRVHYDMAAELAVDAQKHLSFYNDTVQEGEKIKLDLGITNASASAADSVWVRYTIIDQNNVPHVVKYPKQPPISPKTTLISHFECSTEGFAGSNILMVEVNPEGEGNQLEKFKFNNLIYLPFFVTTDKINPVIDITFDGRHILNGELVSAKPQIDIRMKDENLFLPLNDTTDYEIVLLYPDANGTPTIEQLVPFNSPMLLFTPANPGQAGQGNNIASIQINPQFTTDGKYGLVVRAKDRTNNAFAGKNVYKTLFEIITKASISNLVNYPNPFTTQTRFVFTLTGSEVPENLSLQILNISGRVVREINRNELGHIAVGHNITEFAWDGTDQYGDPLGNGVYLYRVISKLNGQNMERYKTSADDYFTKGYGKMYLLR